jgi:hypothetical protein
MVLLSYKYTLLVLLQREVAITLCVYVDRAYIAEIHVTHHAEE